jgi:hypothetical protein
MHAVQSSLPAIVEEEATVLQSVAPTTVHVKNKTEQSVPLGAENGACQEPDKLER